jgi:hypothetical protein
MKGTHWLVIGVVVIAAAAYYFLVWRKRHGMKLGHMPQKKASKKRGWRSKFASIGTHLGDAATGGAVSAAQNAIASATGVNITGLIGG